MILVLMHGITTNVSFQGHLFMSFVMNLMCVASLCLTLKDGLFLIQENF